MKLHLSDTSHDASIDSWGLQLKPPSSAYANSASWFRAGNKGHLQLRNLGFQSHRNFEKHTDSSCAGCWVSENSHSVPFNYCAKNDQHTIMEIYFNSVDDSVLPRYLKFTDGTICKLLQDICYSCLWSYALLFTDLSDYADLFRLIWSLQRLICV